VVAYLDHGDAYAIGALNLGSDHQHAWALNLRSNPRAWVEVRGERRAVRARQASVSEAEPIWQRFIERLPAIANARRLARREVPIFILDHVRE
jgi:deazaflavin-dependent oxidoreductase (nitroreductase family)